MALDVRDGSRVQPAAEHGAHPAGRPARSGSGGLGWLAQVVSGVGLLVLVIAHLVAQHLVVDAPGGLRDRAAVLDYLASTPALVVEALFLLVVTWHALLGVRAVLLDLGPGPALRRRIGWLLVALGAATVGYGGWLLAVLVAAT